MITPAAIRAPLRTGNFPKEELIRLKFPRVREHFGHLCRGKDTETQVAAATSPQHTEGPRCAFTNGHNHPNKKRRWVKGRKRKAAVGSGVLLHPLLTLTAIPASSRIAFLSRSELSFFVKETRYLIFYRVKFAMNKKEALLPFRGRSLIYTKNTSILDESRRLLPNSDS